jgi:gliding motility-associated-like protein
VTWSIPSGADKSKFAISATGALSFVQAPDYEIPTDNGTNNTYEVAVVATDAAGNASTQTVTITVTNVNEAPTDIALSASSVAENAATGTIVGTLSATDVDAGDTFTYTLVSGSGDTDNASFTIDGNTLKTAAVFDYETKSSYSVRVRVTDAGGLSFEKQFTILIIDLNEDSDGDGIWDDVEKGPNIYSLLDTDNDGIPDYLDLDSDSDGYLDSHERNIDTDRDGIPDFQDLDSDSDGIADKVEDDLDFGNIKDCDRDGIENRLDPDVCELILPQIITPNGDGLNDVLIIPGILRLQPNRLTIINRWGSVVFDQENYQNNWGGISFSGELPDGVYYYVVDFKGAKPTITNFIYLDRTGK